MQYIHKRNNDNSNDKDNNSSTIEMSGGASPLWSGGREGGGAERSRERVFYLGLKLARMLTRFKIRVEVSSQALLLLFVKYAPFLLFACVCHRSCATTHSFFLFFFFFFFLYFPCSF